MQQVIHLCIFVFYLISLAVLGRMVIKTWFSGLPVLLEWTGELLVGAGIGVPVTYLLSVLFVKTGEPILWSTVLFLVLVCFLRSLVKINKSTSRAALTASDIFIVIFAVIFSSWLMMKTFRGSGGLLFVGSNNVFDFGHSLGIIRSFSWGNNIPFMSPFKAGLPFFYHFFFYFFVAIWEYFGVPIVWAMNIPSIISFASLLIVVYFLPQILLKEKRLVGWIAVLLTITHSTLTFWYLILQKGFSPAFIRTILRLPTYPFAGPFDGSVISIFMTLNNYVNQRHLAFAIALGLFLIMMLVRLLDEKKISQIQIAVLGAITGSLFLWNMSVCASVGVVIVMLLVLKKRWKEAVIFSIPAIGIILISVSPFILFLKNIWALVSGTMTSSESGGVAQSSRWNVLLYFWENLGILPLAALFGFIVIPKKNRICILPFIVISLVGCIYAGLVSHGFDQKFLSFFIIGINIIAAYAIGWLWQRKKLGFRVLALGVFFVLTVSGEVDLMAVKNEFAFPFVSDETSPVISWIHNNTKKDAVFVSYADIIDPVVLAGRKNYLGFFGNIVQEDRYGVVMAIYNGDKLQAEKHTISYILVPTWRKNDFPYVPNLPVLRKNFPVGYEDPRFVVFEVK